MKNVLLISPYFAPMSVIGAKRAINLSRHLPASGWRPIIFCSAPTRESVDERLNELVGTDAVVSRTYRRPVDTKPRSISASSNANASSSTISETTTPPASPKRSLLERLTGWQPRYLSPFDRDIFEVRHALREGARLIEEHHIDAISVSADPWSALIVASKLSERYRLPLVVDFRDPWTLHSGKSKLRPPPTLAFMRRYERQLFSRASRVILNTESCLRAYQARDQHLLPPHRLTFVRNAFDSSMFGEWGPPRPLSDRPFELTYFGRFRKFVRPDPLFAGIKRFVEQRELSPTRFKLVLIGGLDPYAYEAARRYQIEPWIELRPAISFLESFETLQRADALGLVDGGCPLVIAGKLYDYLNAGRPIISVARSVEVAQVIAESGAGVSADPDDPQNVADHIGALYDRALRGEYTSPDLAKLAPFDASAQAARYAQVLNEALVDYESRI